MPGRIVQFVVLALIYGALAYATLRFGRPAGVAAVIWPAGALALGMLIVSPRANVWPEIAAVAALNALAHLAVGDPVWVSALLGLAHGVTLALTLWMLTYAGISRDQPTRTRTVVSLFFIAICGPVTGAVIGGVTIGFWRLMDPMPFVLWWWLVQAVSLLLLTPPFLFWRSPRERQALRAARTPPGGEPLRLRRRRIQEITLASLALTAAGFLVPLSGETVLLELSATVLLWFALRFGMFSTALTIAIYSVSVVSAALAGFWPGVDPTDLPGLLLPLQATLALTTLPSLLVAAILSQRERARRALDEDARRLAYALEGANDGLWDWHLPTGHAFFSVRYHRMLGYEPDDFEQGAFDWRTLVHPDDLPKSITAFEDHADGRTAFYETEMRCRHKSGHWVWVLDRGKVVERDAAGVALRAVGTHTDISERKELERALEHLATHDPLTGLANRGVFERGLIRAAARLDRQGGRVAIILIDVDHFKAVNDTYGHAVGDLLLTATAARLRAAVRVDDLVARLGGDEFAVVATGQTAAEFDALAERFCAVLSAPVSGVGFEVSPSVSIGVAVASAGVQVRDELVVRADRALYAAKSAGRGTWRFFGGAGKVA